MKKQDNITSSKSIIPTAIASSKSKLDEILDRELKIMIIKVFRDTNSQTK